jgi:predicted nicotinamide N-methyase
MSQRFFCDEAPENHPGISVTRPSQAQRLLFGDFGRKLAPSAEVLAWLISKGTWNLRNKRVLELGAGLGLPGMACAAWTNCSAVQLSDGDPELVGVLRTNIACNRHAGAFSEDCHVEESFIDFRKQKGTVDKGFEDTFDTIICADCVYDVELHIPLLLTLRRFLRPDGKVILMAPPRGGSLNIFLQTARAFFGGVNCSVDYDEIVSRKFRGHKCFPQLVLLKMIDAEIAENFSIFEDETSKRFVERRQRALREEEEYSDHIRRYMGKSSSRTVVLSQDQLNSSIERMFRNTRSRTRSRKGASVWDVNPGLREGSECSGQTLSGNLPPPASTTLHKFAPLRPSSSWLRGRYGKDKDTETAKLHRGIRDSPTLPSSRTSSSRSGSGLSVQLEDDLDLSAGRDSQQNLTWSSWGISERIQRLSDADRNRGSAENGQEDEDKQKQSSMDSFYSHLLQKPQRPVEATWAFAAEKTSSCWSTFYSHRLGQSRWRMWQERKVLKQSPSQRPEKSAPASMGANVLPSQALKSSAKEDGSQRNACSRAHAQKHCGSNAALANAPVYRSNPWVGLNSGNSFSNSWERALEECGPRVKTHSEEQPDLQLRSGMSKLQTDLLHQIRQKPISRDEKNEVLRMISSMRQLARQ